MVSYHVVEDVVENAVFAWDLPIKNDTLPETNIAFGNKPSQKKMSSSNPQFLRAIVSFRDNHPGVGEPMTHLNAVQRDFV